MNVLVNTWNVLSDFEMVGECIVWSTFRVSCRKILTQRNVAEGEVLFEAYRLAPKALDIVEIAQTHPDRRCLQVVLNCLQIESRIDGGCTRKRSRNTWHSKAKTLPMWFLGPLTYVYTGGRKQQGNLVRETLDC